MGKMGVISFAAAAIAAANGVVCAATVTSSWGGRISAETARLTIWPKVCEPNWFGHDASGDFLANEEGIHPFVISTGQDVSVRGGARFSVDKEGRLFCDWRMTADRDVPLAEFGLVAPFASDVYAGGVVVVDGRPERLPVFHEVLHVISSVATNIVVRDAKGAVRFSFAFDEPTDFFIQDDRAFAVNHFTLRLPFERGKGKMFGKRKYQRTFTLALPERIDYKQAQQLVVGAGDGWIPVEPMTNIIKSSAFDFGRILGNHRPAGTFGRLRSVGTHFEFEGRPGVPQRFYGVNLCFGANFLPRGKSQEFAEKLSRMGYNAVRVHHYDNDLLRRWDEFDAQFAAFVENGIYVTTDLFVVRNPPPGYTYAEYKEMIPLLGKEFDDYCSFAKEFLMHRNPYTGRTYAEEPALCLINLINEGNPGNAGSSTYRKFPDWRKRFGKEPPVDILANTDVANEFARMLVDCEVSFGAKMRKRLREDWGCEALVSDWNGFVQRPEYTSGRAVYDYADDHFYVDHPVFPGAQWELPSNCPNENPVRGGADYIHKVERRRPKGIPLVITEYNFSAPGEYRGVGGILASAYASALDWSGLWRFAYSHDATGCIDPTKKPITFFDVSGDPLGMASDRASLCMFIRRDLDVGGQSSIGIDSDRGVLRIVTPRTCGVFAEQGSYAAGELSVSICKSPATVWVSSLDGEPVSMSSRLLLTHLTDAQNTGARFADASKRTLLSWGTVPALMRVGAAEIALTVSRGDWHVYALSSDGARKASVGFKENQGVITFRASTDCVGESATFAYEIVR